MEVYGVLVDELFLTQQNELQTHKAIILLLALCHKITHTQTKQTCIIAYPQPL